MHAHTHLSHKYTLATYICIMHTYRYRYIYVYACIHTHIYPVLRTRSYTHTRGRPHMRMPTRLRAHTRARIGGAAAHNGPRRTDDPPSASRPRWRAARSRKGGAYPTQVRHSRGVPCADVRVERRRILERLRAEPPTVHRGRNALACVGADAWAPNRTRTYARKDNTWLMKALYFKTKVAHG